MNRVSRIDRINTSQNITKNSNWKKNYKARRKSFHYYNCNINLKNKFILLFTFFSIALATGIQPQLQTTEAFDDSIINDNISEKEDANNGNGNSDNKSDKVIISDPANTDLTSDSTAIHQTRPHSVNADTKILSNDKSNDELDSKSGQSSINDATIDSNINENANGNIIAQDDKPSAEMIHADTQIDSTDTQIDSTDTQIDSTDTQIDTLNSNTNNNVNENPIVTQLNDNSNTESTSNPTSQSQSSDQPRYKSYRDFMDNNSNSSGQESDDLTEKPQNDELSYADSQMITTNSNIKLNLNTKNDVTIIDPAIQSNTQSSLETSTSEIRAQPNEKVYGDFNGDGKDDVAIGVPLEDVDIGGTTIIDAGAVNVLYGSSNGLSATTPKSDQFWTQSTTDVSDVPEEGDLFGSSVSAGDFNGDGFDDLAIGVTHEDVDTGRGTIGDAGAVNVLYGSSNGLSATSPKSDQFWTQDSSEVNDVPEEGDLFGSSVSAGDFNGDGKDDLAIGVQFEDVDTGGQNIVNAGAVNILYGSSNGLSATSPKSDQFWTQDSSEVNDVPEEGDLFGSSLSAGDFNGDGKDDLAIGVLDEDDTVSILIINGAGAFNVLYGSSNGLSARSPTPDQF
ncbi:MAG TPA: FG-GAP repeat protein [Nitrososphaeraceae archaeon]|nr:FG-GAP repeat protein [Nitrososphaeraceae archaeon]